MKLGEAIPKYQAYRNQLQDKKKDIYKQLKNARDKAERTGNDEWTQKAAQLQLSYDKASEDFDKYENALNGLREQWCAASDAENAKALADPETGLGATIAKILTTVARMCAGDKVPYSDEKKVMEYDDKMRHLRKSARNTIHSGIKRVESMTRRVWQIIHRRRESFQRLRKIQARTRVLIRMRDKMQA